MEIFEGLGVGCIDPAFNSYHAHAIISSLVPLVLVVLVWLLYLVRSSYARYHWLKTHPKSPQRTPELPPRELVPLKVKRAERGRDDFSFECAHGSCSQSYSLTNCHCRSLRSTH